MTNDKNQLTGRCCSGYPNCYHALKNSVAPKMTNDDKDLKPCPWGHKAEIKKHRRDYFSKKVEYWFFPSCTDANCPAYNEEQDEQGGCHCDCKTEKEAVDLWNTRAKPQQPSEPLKELDREELISICESWKDEPLTIVNIIMRKFGQPTEKKALSVLDIARIIHKESGSVEPFERASTGEQDDAMATAQAIHSALPARKEVKWPEKMEHGCDPNGYCDCSASDANEMRDACIAAYEEAIPAQREVRYPEKMEEERFYCEDGDIYRGREWNQAIDEFKKLNS